MPPSFVVYSLQIAVDMRLVHASLGAKIPAASCHLYLFPPPNTGGCLRIERPCRLSLPGKIKIGVARLCRAVTRSRWGSTESHPTVRDGCAPSNWNRGFGLNGSFPGCLPVEQTRMVTIMSCTLALQTGYRRTRNHFRIPVSAVRISVFGHPRLGRSLALPRRTSPQWISKGVVTSCRSGPD
jgi:hypothetical protein